MNVETNVKEIEKAQAMISALRLLMETLPGGKELLEQVEANEYDESFVLKVLNKDYNNESK
jgi:hypothetical protein